MLVARELVRRALGVRPEQCASPAADDEPEPPEVTHDGSYDLGSALKRSGGFFLMADTSAIAVPQRYLDEATPAAPDGVTRDWAFCRWLALEGGVIAIPSSPFYSGPNKALASNYIRFAFCKSDDTLVEACERIEKLIRSSADS